MFGNLHYLKDIKMITTHNAIKWTKFMDLMGGTPKSAYSYWCDRVHRDGDIWGIVKTDHPSKLGQYQQLSYQMLNTLPCTREDVQKIARASIDYVESLKNDNDVFEKFLRKNANEVNHYEMLADLYRQNNDFGGYHLNIFQIVQVSEHVPYLISLIIVAVFFAPIPEK